MDLALDSWFVTGPTASGKTDVGIALARRIDGEIISLDSMAVYRGMDIGTAKPNAAQQAAVPHHLIDVVEPAHEWSVAQYLAAAEEAARDISARGRQVIFVGGTPLYLKAVLRGMFEGPEADWTIRRRWEEAARGKEPAWLHAQLAAVDPAAAARLHPNDHRRIIRALEFHERTGTPISEWQLQFDRACPAESVRVFVLDWPRDVLYERINARVDAMFAAGLVEETQRLLEAGVQFGRTARQSLGYRETLEYLRGERSLEETVALVKTRTRQFAKRQLTWFRSLSECRWIACTAGCDAASIAQEIFDQASRAPGRPSPDSAGGGANLPKADGDN